VVEIPSGREIDRSHPEILDTPILPGSIAKVPLLAAALETGVATPRTTLTCRRDVEAGGARLACVHPDLGRPLDAAEALAHSCNSFFAALAERIPRGALNASRTALGLPALAASDALVAGALGLAGPGVTPRALIRLLSLVADAGTPLRRETREVLLAGLRGAAAYGTASALADTGEGVLAKTGTAPMPGGGSEGIVVAFRPDLGDRLDAGVAVIVIAPGASGRDAAAIAREWLRARQAGGRVRVGEVKDGRYRVAALALEDYVARAVAGEGAADAPPAALEALAVVARTFARGGQGGHDRDGFDVCDLTHCLALRAPGAAASEAARKTRGRILTVRDRPARVWVSASCGGRTAMPAEIWGNRGVRPQPDQDGPSVDFSYLASRAEPECRTESRWRAEIAERDLGRALRGSGIRGDLIRSLTVVARTASGRVARVHIGGFEPPDITAEQFRLAVGRALGWNLVRSHAFDITRTATGYRFEGTGFGHGVGLCVSGAARMAAKGDSAPDILRAYFPGAQLVTRPEGEHVAAVRLVLPESDERERPAIEALVNRIVADLGRQTGLDTPPALTVRFHPTVESLSRSTGRPWFVAGSTRGDLVELLPAPVLRGRGTLESVLRHELAHAFVDGHLEGRALWVREGAAVYFTGQAKEDPTAACPSDDEFQTAASLEAMKDVYARAGACFAREIESGRRWQQVGRPRDL
jgi:SpoIID/LytB domain protein